MDLIRDWAMTICGVIIFGSICEMIVPNGSIKKYVRLALGLMLILTLASPITKLMGADLTFSGFEEKSVQAYLSAEQMSDKQRSDVIRIYKQNLSSKLKGAVESRLDGYEVEVKPEVETADQSRFCEITKVLVLVDTGSDTMDITSQVQTIVKDTCGVLESRVEVRYLNQT